jgi:hypothetical protein
MAGFWYRAGTVSVTNASKKVVGSGTLFKTTTFKPDKGHALYGPDGKPYEIDYVESDTVLYLVKAYTGATASGQSYEIDITRTSTIPALSREISAQLAYAQGQYDSWQQILTGSGNVTLFAPDGQSVTVPALSNMLSKSGNLAGLADKPTARNNLGLGDVAVKTVQTSQTDLTAGHVMLTGAFGLGSIGLPRVFDANTVWANGWYSYNRDAGDVEGPEMYGTILYTGHTGNGMAYAGWQTQIFFGVAGSIYFRNNSGPNTFQGATWKRLWTEHNFPVVSGSFTPIINVPGVEILRAVGKYWRKGDVCHFQSDITIGTLADAPADNSSNLKITGLPFVMANTGLALPLAISASNLRVTEPVALVEGAEVIFVKLTNGAGDMMRVSDIKPKTYGGSVVITLSGWCPIA